MGSSQGSAVTGQLQICHKCMGGSNRSTGRIAKLGIGLHIQTSFKLILMSYGWLILGCLALYSHQGTGGGGTCNHPDNIVT